MLCVGWNLPTGESVFLASILADVSRRESRHYSHNHQTSLLAHTGALIRVISDQAGSIHSWALDVLTLCSFLQFRRQLRVVVLRVLILANR